MTQIHLRLQQFLYHGKDALNENTKDKVIAAVCDYYGLQEWELMKKSNSRKFVLPRQVAMYLLRNKGFTWVYIGGVFRKDHTTVIYSHTLIRNLMVGDLDLYIALQKIQCNI